MDEIMFNAMRKGKEVHIVCVDGTEYTGKAVGYSQGADEEDGFSTISVETKNNGNWCLGENEIISIEYIA